MRWAGSFFVMRSPFFIVGPTAVGKTALAVAVAERCGAEIVNADAFQLYAGLDLLTAKPSPEERRRVPHHLVGTVPLSGDIQRRPVPSGSPALPRRHRATRDARPSSSAAAGCTSRR